MLMNVTVIMVFGLIRNEKANVNSARMPDSIVFNLKKTNRQSCESIMKKRLKTAVSFEYVIAICNGNIEKINALMSPVFELSNRNVTKAKITIIERILNATDSNQSS